MSPRVSVWFLLVLVLFGFIFHSNAVPSLPSKVTGQNVCKFNDPVCLTRAANRVYKVLLNGVKGLFEPIDPIYVSKINGSMLTLDYQLYNATLEGLKDCYVELFKIENDKLAYEYRLHCPQLVINYYYEAKGTLEDHDIDGAGLCTIIADDYLITFKGLLEKVYSEIDHADRIGVKDYHFETELRKKFTFENEKLSRGDNEIFKFVKSYINGNWKKLEQFLRSPILESFLGVFVKTIDTYARAYPLNEVLWDDQE